MPDEVWSVHGCSPLVRLVPSQTPDCESPSQQTLEKYIAALGWRNPSMLEIRTDDLSGEPTRGLLALHLLGMSANSPPRHMFALDLSGLQDSEVAL
jgi:hypothetical protein